MNRNEQIEIIASRFVDVMQSWLTPEEFAEMKHLNETDSDYASGACASHNYCDANMAMCEAFESVMGKTPDGDNDGDALIWNDAWNLARIKALGHQDAYQDVLDQLAQANGAILYWQLGIRAKEAFEAGIVTIDESDLMVHPKAIKIEEGSYRMP